MFQNLLDSHDTDRIISAIKNRKGWKKGRVQDENPDYDVSKPSGEDYQILKLLTIIQFTYPGAPMIYYGDEAGMWGAYDHSSRQPMLWADLEPYDNVNVKFNKVIFEHYSKLITHTQHLLTFEIRHVQGRVCWR